jgi:tRNA (guanine26-N2/guanine27-N2)-dimethyltransferase
MERQIETKKFRLAVSMRKMVALIESESNAPIGYYVIDKLCDMLSLPVPSVKYVVETLKKEGFQAMPTHFNSRGIRSDISACKLTAILQDLTDKAHKRT